MYDLLSARPNLQPPACLLAFSGLAPARRNRSPAASVVVSGGRGGWVTLNPVFILGLEQVFINLHTIVKAATNVCVVAKNSANYLLNMR